MNVTSQNIVAFEKHLSTTPDPRTGKLRHPNTILSYLSSFTGVFTVAVQSILLDPNPMDKVAVGTKIDLTSPTASSRCYPELHSRPAVVLAS